MTKQVRIENADTSDHRLRVEVYETSTDGQDLLIEKHDLPYPTAMAHIPIHSSRWLKVIEVPATDNEVGPGMP